MTTFNASDIVEEKKLFSPPCPHILFPLRYEWAWENYKDMLANHWTPMEIPMAPDIHCWDREMEEHEKVMFETVFAQLTTFDLLRGIDISESLSGVISTPEIKHALATQAFQEALHTHAYQYCIENLGLDQISVYTMYLKHPALLNRVKFASECSESIKNLQSKAYESPINGAIYSEEQITHIFLATAFWYLAFEGIWFMANLFGPIQSLAVRGKMKATAEQFQYIARDETLHVSFGVSLLKSMIAEHPHLASKPVLKSVRQIIVKAVDLEYAFAEHAIVQKTINYSIETHMDIVYALANRRLESIGLEKAFPSVDIPSWIEAALVTKKEKNFFETRVTDYALGQLDLVFQSESMGNISDWKK